MTEPIKVLDHGFIRLVEAWGHGDAGISLMVDSTQTSYDFECGIIEAARQSTQGSFRGWEQDQRLLAFLFNNKPQHATPFEFAGAVIEVKAPIFVFREWQRHRTQSYNEMSARYAPLPADDYLPETSRCFLSSQKNKQAGTLEGADELTEENASRWLHRLRFAQEELERLYQDGLSIGMPKEIARGAMTVFRYSQMRASTNLRNWLAFMTLRSDPAAQYEIRMYAEALGTILAKCFPQTWRLFNLGRSPSAS